MEIYPIGVSGHSYLNAYIYSLRYEQYCPCPILFRVTGKTNNKKEKNYFVRVFIICSQRFFDSIQ